MRFVNLTPHAINIYRDGDLVRLVEPDGAIARITVSPSIVCEIEGVNVFRDVEGTLTGLPSPQQDVVFITSRMVASAVKRGDVMSPGTLIRDAKGQPVGCEGLTSFAEE